MNTRLGEVTDLDSQVNSIIGLAKEILEDMSDFEANMIRTSVRLIYSAPPSTKLLITERITQLNQSKADLNYLILKAREVRRAINIPYTEKYNMFYTFGTKKGLPSKQAIESDMYHSHKDLKTSRDKLDDIDTLIEFLNSYLGLIDRSISTLDSRRYDL